jgi:cyclopropane fatty-acyl-phospholipid synthase-like methyltransferase
MSNFQINERGFWESTDAEGHLHDTMLCQGIIKILKHENSSTIVDFGCGMGDYARTLIQNGISCEAFDGNPNTESLTNGLGKVLDFSLDFDLNKKFDAVLSLEVGEHIPKEYEQIFLNNICKHTDKTLILSWAVIGQGGDGHVNCQNNDYIINELTKRGFRIDVYNSNFLRQVSLLPWFKNTIMVFRKEKISK